ncbi:MAG TPA: hypothetical protein VEK86_05260 [Gemmatimonadales bacterium]|nr:hypothetical protein [Gemmatimonadales bacterium]
MAAVLLSAGPPVRLSAQTIDTIVVVNHNVFDLGEDGETLGSVARVANALHVTTRSRVIRRRLLVNPGDRYDSARVAESARALRTLNVFAGVRLDTIRIGGRLALRVETTDGWSTKPQLGYSTTGGDATWLVGMVEENLLGTATSLTAVYNKTPDRGTFEFGYLNPHFFGRRTRLAAVYSDKSDGQRGLWLVGVPFYETAARRALTTDGEAASERVLVFRKGELDTTRTAERRALRVGVTMGLAARATSRDYVRLWLGGQWRREDFAPLTTTVFARSVFAAAGAGIDLGRVRFQVLERFNSYARREDVDVSQLLHVGVWAAPRAWGYSSDRAGVGPELGGQVSALWRGGFAVLRGWANGVYTGDGGSLDSARVTGRLTVASQNLPGHTLIFQLEGGALRRPKPGAEFDLWLAQKGPRVFGIHQFSGTRMAALVLEDRILVSDEVWGLMGVGVAPFFDYGGAWYAEDPARLGGNVGLSLRLGPTRAVRGDVAEIAIGYRFGDGRTGGRWGFSLRKGIVF